VIPSIFNNVIGPVMRGPSSSHCAGALRIGHIARDLMKGRIGEVLIEFDKSGSLANTHKSQGSDMGLFAGLMGWKITDKRMVFSPSAIKATGVKTKIQIKNFGAAHPNTYKIKLKNEKTEHQIIALSKGGGMIEISEIDGISLSIEGDYFETIIFLKRDNEKLINKIKKSCSADYIFEYKEDDKKLIEIKAQNFLGEKIIKELKNSKNMMEVIEIEPILPVLSRKNIKVPFLNCKEMMAFNKNKNLKLWELALRYESIRGNISEREVYKKMKDIVLILKDSIRKGLKGTNYKNRILGFQSGKYRKLSKQGKLINTGVMDTIIAYVTALMEIKSSMGVIVAAPTAGACGALPGACIGAGETQKMSVDRITKAMLSAGIIGIFIAEKSTFAAEIGGCQAECGSGSGMAAAGLVTLMDGTVKQSLSASSMALQNILGMVCDPVANRVEVPCLGKNIMAACNALNCANMAIANYDSVIPLDEVIETMDKVGKSIPVELRCTALGGLSITKTSKKLEKKLESVEE